ncbi:DUF2842 domain-containing protein [Sphingomonas flavalba]|uniref:DUF2842 domain-containing protein n=1 Tax=Sphingomonas flavalba TaxID=2559804 RepID=UPI0039E08509
MKPNWRKPAGMLLILALIALWSTLVVGFSDVIGALPALVQAPIYLVLGIVWILPLKPLLRWMETGRWR